MPVHGANAVEQTFREEYARAVSVLTRVLGDLTLAEDAVAEAFTVACRRWPRDGVPPSPAGWIITTARRKAVDQMRREANRERKHLEAALLQEPEPAASPGVIGDDLLRLIFTCCHPALSRPAQVALTLRLLGGMRTAEIARAFLVSESAMARRLVRAKAKIRDAGIPYEVPQAADLEQRWVVVLDVLYLIYNEGYVATEGPGLGRDELCAQALRLARMVVDLTPGEHEPVGLLALLLLLQSRRAARISPDGGVVLLADQDRTRWDQQMVLEALELLRALPQHAPAGPYRLQAAINAVHAGATSIADTDWAQLVLLYDALLQVRPSHVVRLNRTVAVAEAGDPAAAWRALQELDLDGYSPYYAVCGYVLSMLGRTAKARDYYDAAIVRTRNGAERAALRRRRDALGR